MKKKVRKRKLFLNQKTIANLGRGQMNQVFGGDTWIVSNGVDFCPDTIPLDSHSCYKYYP